MQASNQYKQQSNSRGKN